MENSTSQSDSSNQPPFYKRKAFIYLSIACIALITTGIAAMFHKNYPGVKLKDLAAELINNDVPPGGNRAVLTTASGKKIVLNEAADGELGEESGLIFRKTGNGELMYETSAEVTGNLNEDFHTITTPKGGTYQITLPDGSRVWLNAGSTLTFPLNLVHNKERRIEISGEAYLEVTKGAMHPFRVSTNHQLIKVLGTHFNINNYTDDHVVKTTLLEGSLKMRPFGKEATSSEDVVLKVGQQGIIERGSINVVRIDTAEVLAWKNGLFICNNEPLESIMKRVSRWYDIDVVYQDIDTSKLFDVKVSRFEHVSKVLSLLEKAGGVHFKMEPGKIIAMK